MAPLALTASSAAHLDTNGYASPDPSAQEDEGSGAESQPSDSQPSEVQFDSECVDPDEEEDLVDILLVNVLTSKYHRVVEKFDQPNWVGEYTSDEHEQVSVLQHLKVLSVLHDVSEVAMYKQFRATDARNHELENLDAVDW